MNLYEIDKAILACIDPETGELIDEEALAALQMERTEKIKNVALWLKNLNASVTALKAERDAFDERMKAGAEEGGRPEKVPCGCFAGAEIQHRRVRSELPPICSCDRV